MLFLRKHVTLLALLLAGILWGIISLFVRQLSAYNLPNAQIVLLRCCISTLLLGGFLGIRAPKLLRIRLQDIWMFIGTGIVSLFFFNLCYFYVISHGYAAVGGVLLYTSPAFILLLSALLFKEKFTQRKFIALLLTLAGCILVSGLCTQTQRIPLKIFVYGIGSGFFYALYSIFSKFAFKRYDSLTITFYTFLFASIASLFTCNPATILQFCRAEPRIIPWSIGLAFFCATLPYILYTWGLMRTSAGRASILVAVEPMVCAILGMCVYGEAHTPLKILGVACILAAILALSRSDS